MKKLLFLFSILAFATSHVNPIFKNKFIPKLPSNDEPKVLNPKFHKPHYPVFNISPYIDGGTEVDPIDKYPFLVLLDIDFAYNCNGALISDEWVLTAAHCLFGSFYVDVYLGQHDLSTPEGTEVTIHASEYIINAIYDSTTNANDIALVHLEKKVDTTDAINSVALPSVNDEDLGEGIDVTIIGWKDPTHVQPGHPNQRNKSRLQRKQGNSLITRRVISEAQRFDQRGALTNTAYDVVVETISSSECAIVYGSSAVQADKICTSHTNGGADTSDAGPPVVYDSLNGIQLRGIVSSASASGQGLPDIHTRVTHYLDWIQTNTGINLS